MNYQTLQILQALILHITTVKAIVLINHDHILGGYHHALIYTRKCTLYIWCNLLNHLTFVHLHYNTVHFINSSLLQRWG